MTGVCDLSPGTVLVSRFSGWKFVVRRESDSDILVEGPDGVQRVDRERLELDIANGRVQVL